jgi:hypothetical protein
MRIVFSLVRLVSGDGKQVAFPPCVVNYFFKVDSDKAADASFLQGYSVKIFFFFLFHKPGRTPYSIRDGQKRSVLTPHECGFVHPPFHQGFFLVRENVTEKAFPEL